MTIRYFKEEYVRTIVKGNHTRLPLDDAKAQAALFGRVDPGTHAALITLLYAVSDTKLSNVMIERECVNGTVSVMIGNCVAPFSEYISGLHTRLTAGVSDTPVVEIEEATYRKLALGGIQDAHLQI